MTGTVSGMRWASACSTLTHGASAAREAADAVRATLEGGPVDLVLAFYTPHHVSAAPEVSQVLRETLTPQCLMGASAHGVISHEHELESGAALSLVAARLPGVQVHPFVLMSEMWQPGAEGSLAFAQTCPGALGAELVLLLADPFTLDIERVLATFNRHAHGVRVVGGMASAGGKPNSNALLLNDWIANEGGVAVALHGDLRCDVIVSQGCRPIGPPLEITRSNRNLVMELDGQPALERIEQVLQSLAPLEQQRLERGLYVGRPVNASAEGRGDYLIRNLLGADRERGVIAIGDLAREREKLRLHVRDADTAREDMELLLSPQSFDSKAEGALLFACNGRGTGLFGKPDGDIVPLQEALGGVPTAGMFCAGEIGPVGATNFLHGHTASIAIVRGGRAPVASE